MLSSACVNLRVTISSRDATVHNTEGGGGRSTRGGHAGGGATEYIATVILGEWELEWTRFNGNTVVEPVPMLSAANVEAYRWALEGNNERMFQDLSQIYRTFTITVLHGEH